VRKTVSLVAVAFVAFALAASAQEMKPQKFQGPWYRVLNVKFKTGQMDKAFGIINKYFMPATTDAGTPGPKFVLAYSTGPWDVTIVWSLDGGPGDLEWHHSPNGIKWFTALAKRAGGTDKAQEIYDEYLGTVAKSSMEVAHGWETPMPKNMEK
jgi:hypothetical protein